VCTLSTVVKTAIEDKHHALIEIEPTSVNVVDKWSAVARVYEIDPTKSLVKPKQRYIATAEGTIAIVNDRRVLRDFHWHFQ
jgi:hypothetical protein